MTEKFAPGAHVRVRTIGRKRAGLRTSARRTIVRGAARPGGADARDLQEPGRPGVRPPCPAARLYQVRFDRQPIWQDPGPGDHLNDDLLVEIFEQWLEPA